MPNSIYFPMTEVFTTEPTLDLEIFSAYELMPVAKYPNGDDKSIGYVNNYGANLGYKIQHIPNTTLYFILWWQEGSDLTSNSMAWIDVANDRQYEVNANVRGVNIFWEWYRFYKNPPYELNLTPFVEFIEQNFSDIMAIIPQAYLLKVFLAGSGLDIRYEKTMVELCVSGVWYQRDIRSDSFAEMLSAIVEHEKSTIVKFYKQEV